MPQITILILFVYICHFSDLVPQHTTDYHVSQAYLDFSHAINQYLLFFMILLNAYFLVIMVV